MLTVESAGRIRNLLVLLYVINLYIYDHLLKEYNLENFLAVVDYEKAIDRLGRNKLWNVVMVRNFLQHVVREIQNLCHETEMIIVRREQLLIKV